MLTFLLISGTTILVFLLVNLFRPGPRIHFEDTPEFWKAMGDTSYDENSYH